MGLGGGAKCPFGPPFLGFGGGHGHIGPPPLDPPVCVGGARLGGHVSGFCEGLHCSLCHLTVPTGNVFTSCKGLLCALHHQKECRSQDRSKVVSGHYIIMKYTCGPHPLEHRRSLTFTNTADNKTESSADRLRQMTVSYPGVTYRTRQRRF